MHSQIEIYDQKRKKYRSGHILGLVIFFIAWIVRSIIKVGDLDLDVLETLAMTVLLLAVIFQAYFALRFNLLEREINKDPFLKEALNDELMHLNQLKAWRAAFFSLIIFIVMVAILSFFITFNDLMLIFITALLVGFGTYNTTLYILDRE
jgi:hypothetical protein